MVNAVPVAAYCGIRAHRKQQVGSAYIFDEADSVKVEVADIAEVDVLERACEKRHESISVAVLEYNERSAVFAFCLNVRYSVVTAEYHVIVRSCEVLGIVEQRHIYGVGERGGILRYGNVGLGFIEYEVLGIVEERCALRVAVESAHISGSVTVS